MGNLLGHQIQAFRGGITAGSGVVGLVIRKAFALTLSLTQHAMKVTSQMGKAVLHKGKNASDGPVF